MDGIVGGQGAQGQSRRKEWRAVSSEGAGTRGRLFEGPAPATTPTRMSLGPRYPSRQTTRNGRVFHPDGGEPENPNAGDREQLLSQSAKNGEHVEEMHQQIDHGDLERGDSHVEGHDEALQHRLSEISRQREQLQQVELELRARFLARNEILRLQTSFDDQAKQHDEIVARLQEQLQEREEQIQQLRLHLEERERQLQMETSQVWAKDGLLREQTNELATLRRERDNALAEHKAEAAQLDAERADHLAQVEGLKEQVHEKERRLQEIEEQDILLANDKQLRDAQLWMARAQELEAYHVNAMHAELRDRSEQMTQLWVNCQRQVADVERYYNQIIQKLQQDMAESNHFLRNSKEGVALDGRGTTGIGFHQIKPGMMPLEGSVPMMVAPDGLSKVEHATGLPVLPTPVLGMTSVLPPSANMANMHQYGAMQQQGVGSTLQSQFPQPGQVQPVPPVLVGQQPPIKHQQATNYNPVQIVHRQRQQQHVTNPAGQSQVSSQESHSQLKSEPDPANEQASSQVEKMFSALSSQQHSYIEQAQHQTEQISPEILHNQQSNHSGGFNSVIERNKASSQVASKNEQSMHSPQRSEKENINGQQQYHQPEENIHQELQQSHEHNLLQPSIHEDKPAFSHEVVIEGSENQHGREEDLSPLPTPGGQSSQPQSTSESNGKSMDSHLLDRDSLLACLVRVIPAEPSAKIRISSTLPNRLAKILAPLHWHDYRKHYGRLDEFVEAHPQLFVIEGDFIHLREGAHAIVSASTAVAKAAAAAASMPSGAIQIPTVALTPVAQPQLQRSRSAKFPLTERVLEPAVPQQDKKRSISNQSSGSQKQNPDAAAANGQANYGAKNVNLGTSKAESKRPSGAKENGRTSADAGSNGYGNGVLDGYVNFNRATGYLKNMHQANRNQDIGARPQTQEGRILEAATLAQ